MSRTKPDGGGRCYYAGPGEFPDIGPLQMVNWLAAGCHHATRIAAGVVQPTKATRGESRRLVHQPDRVELKAER
jgi:hypothetical protein